MGGDELLNIDSRDRRPKFVGRYLIGDLIGEGSYSKVKEVIDSETLERRAIKIMKKQRLKKIPNGEENVRRETKLMTKLDHKNVIKLVDIIYNDEKQKLYIIMEYCVTVLQELFDRAPDNKLPMSQAHHYFVQLIDGLEYLHSQGIIHKDIKPSNLLINNANVIKITDLGVSEQLNLYTEDDWCSTSQGSPAFQAPELTEGSERFSGYKIDIWSSGVTLFSITTGRYPFEGENIFRLFEKISKGSFTMPQDLDPALQNLLLGMLTKDPDKRYSLHQVKSHDWVRRKHPPISEHVSLPCQPASLIPDIGGGIGGVVGCCSMGMGMNGASNFAAFYGAGGPVGGDPGGSCDAVLDDNIKTPMFSSYMQQQQPLASSSSMAVPGGGTGASSTNQTSETSSSTRQSSTKDGGSTSAGSSGSSSFMQPCLLL